MTLVLFPPPTNSIPDNAKTSKFNIGCGGEWSVVGKEDFSQKLIVAWKKAPGKICEVVNGVDDDVAVKIGLFDLKTTEMNVIFESNEQLNVVNCTVDSSLKVLALVCETIPSYGFAFTDSSQSEASMAEVTYSCYWTSLNANLSENGFVNPLNKESQHMMKVQLLSHTQLLILNPAEAIYLYTLPACDYHNANLGPVLYERLCGSFLWAEYKSSVGQLFYIYLKMNQQQQTNRANTTLIGLQFHSGTAFETVLNTPIELCQFPSQDAHIKCNFNPFSNNIYNPILNVDISIFALTDGEVYICQGLINRNNNNVKTEDEMVHEDESEVDIRYDVSLLHHSCILQCQVKGKIKHGAKKVNNKIIFVPLKDSMLVLLPGVFTHLLDVGLDHQPCNHLLLYDCSLSSVECEELIDVIVHSDNTFSYLLCKKSQIRHFLVGVSIESLLETFESAEGTSVQQNIIHHLLVHHEDLANAEKLMTKLKVDPTEPNVVKLFEEYLLGGSFVLTKQKLDKTFAQLLPMSVAQPFHPQQQMYLEGDLLVTVTYTMLKNVMSVLLSPTERHLRHGHGVMDVWLRLWHRHRSSTSASSSARFSSRSMRDEVVAKGDLSPSLTSSYAFCPLSHISQDCPAHPAASFARQFLLHSNSSQQFNNNWLLESEFEGLTGDGYSKLEQVVFLNLKEISSHLSRHVASAPPNVIKDCASTYVTHCLEQSQRLCSIVFELTNRKTSSQHFDCDPYIYMNEMKANEGRELFVWLERYLVAVEEVVFPLPKGFEAFFSLLAYKCLDIRRFLDYVDHGVVQLNGDVLRCLTADAKAVAKTMPQMPLYDDNIMLEIISRLPKEIALQFLQNLQCSTSRLLQVHHIVERYCNHQCNKSIQKTEELKVNDALFKLSNANCSSSDDELHFSACEKVDLSQPIITAVTAFMCFLQQNDIAGVDKRRGKAEVEQPRGAGYASAADMKLMKETQLRNLVNHDIDCVGLVSQRLNVLNESQSIMGNNESFLKQIWTGNLRSPVKNCV